MRFFSVIPQKEDTAAQAKQPDAQETSQAQPPKEPLPIRVRIDGVEYSMMKLEHATFVIEGYYGSLEAPQRFNFHFVFELDGEFYEVPSHGTIRKLEDGRMKASFFAPQPYHQKKMRRVLGKRAPSAA